MIGFILLEGGNSSSALSPENVVASIFFILLALVIIGLGAFVGYNAFKPKNKK